MNNALHDSEILLTTEQKRQIDDLIVLFSQKQISISEMYNGINAIKYGHLDSHVFSNANIAGSKFNNPVHIP